MARTDFEILMRANQVEKDPRNKREFAGRQLTSWEPYHVGASRQDMIRLLGEELVVVSFKSEGRTWYRLAKKGSDLIFAQTMEQKMEVTAAITVLEAMKGIVGFDDVKETIASAIELQRRTHFILSGPPACAKSLMIEAVRQTVPGSYPVFGSRTSAAGLSEVLFEHQPTVLLIDELDKLRMDSYSVLLGLMESGEILETKSGKTRGIKLKTMVIGACNRTDKMPPELLSRFALHVAFPKYTRSEFIDVCRGFLARENCPEEVGQTIGELVYDYQLGDVRKARGVWQLMKEPTEEEATRVVEFMQKYSPNTTDDRTRTKKKAQGNLL